MAKIDQVTVRFQTVRIVIKSIPEPGYILISCILDVFICMHYLVYIMSVRGLIRVFESHNDVDGGVAYLMYIVNDIVRGAISPAQNKTANPSSSCFVRWTSNNNK